MKMEQTECSETSAYKLQTPGNYPKESIQHTCNVLQFLMSDPLTAHKMHLSPGHEAL